MREPHRKVKRQNSPKRWKFCAPIPRQLRHPVGANCAKTVPPSNKWHTFGAKLALVKHVLTPCLRAFYKIFAR